MLAAFRIRCALINARQFQRPGVCPPVVLAVVLEHGRPSTGGGIKASQRIRGIQFVQESRTPASADNPLVLRQPVRLIGDGDQELIECLGGGLVEFKQVHLAGKHVVVVNIQQARHHIAAVKVDDGSQRSGGGLSSQTEGVHLAGFNSH